MYNLVFRFYLTVTLCWQCGIAERSANGYFYDKPEGTLFDESPGTVHLPDSVPVFQAQQVPSQVGYVSQLQQGPDPFVPVNVNIIPSNLVYENSQRIDSGAYPIFQQQGSQNFGSSANFVQDLQNKPNFVNPGGIEPSQQIYRGSGGGNLQSVAFNVQDGSQSVNNVQQPCGPEPIIAQYNPQLVGPASVRPITRLIKTCGPNNDCNTIALQSDLNRVLGALSAQTNAPSRYQTNYQIQPRTPDVGTFAADSLLVRPPGRRLIQYSEIERDDPYN